VLYKAVLLKYMRQRFNSATMEIVRLSRILLVLKLRLNFSDGDPRNEFFISRHKGDVHLAKQLDWETQNKYNLTISVTDYVHTVYTQVRAFSYYSTLLTTEMYQVPDVDFNLNHAIEIVYTTQTKINLKSPKTFFVFFFDFFEKNSKERFFL